MLLAWCNAGVLSPKTGASLALGALRWVATVFDVDLQLSNGLVVQQSHAHHHTHRLPPLVDARCPSEQLLIHLGTFW